MNSRYLTPGTLLWRDNGTCLKEENEKKKNKSNERNKNQGTKKGIWGMVVLIEMVPVNSCI